MVQNSVIQRYKAVKFQALYNGHMHRLVHARSAVYDWRALKIHTSDFRDTTNTIPASVQARFQSHRDIEYVKLNIVSSQ